MSKSSVTSLVYQGRRPWREANNKGRVSPTLRKCSKLMLCKPSGVIHQHFFGSPSAPPLPDVGTISLWPINLSPRLLEILTQCSNGISKWSKTCACQNPFPEFSWRWNTLDHTEQLVTCSIRLVKAMIKHLKRVHYSLKTTKDHCLCCRQHLTDYNYDWQHKSKQLVSKAIA